MYSIYDQINNRKVLVYPERTSVITNPTQLGTLTNDQNASTYFPNDIDDLTPVINFEKVEVGEGNYVYHGDNIDVLRTLPDNSVDSVVTDPPYGLKFMKKQWDYEVPSVELWKECYRVLKPGGYLLSFGSSRTYHRMVVKVEDAGFEIRDQIMWVYGSGFPKSHNVGLSIDKLLGHPDRGHRIAVASRTHPDGTFEPNGEKLQPYETISIEAKPFEGFGTALKPAHEPIVVARKPLSEKSVAKNVLKWNTGGLNIDKCRIGNKEITTNGFGSTGFVASENYSPTKHIGRFPANIIFDEESGILLDKQSGVLKSGKLKITHKRQTNGSPIGIYGKFNPKHPLSESYGDKGGASRFFYCPKPSKKEREDGLTSDAVVIKGRDEGQDKRNVPQKIRTTVRRNTHTTVKPTALMQYLISLVTPIGGVTVDPFFGSGTSGKSVIIENDYKFIGIEKEKEYFDIAVERCKYEMNKSIKIAA
jgi:site-specific DNA-methyltransferase (adenine-specific)